MIEVIPGIEEDVAIKENTQLQHGMAIILYNDDVNTFEHAVECLIKYCGHDGHQAEQCALITHYNGKCDVKRGDFDELKPIHEALLDNHLSAAIEELA